MILRASDESRLSRASASAAAAFVSWLTRSATCPCVSGVWVTAASTAFAAVSSAARSASTRWRDPCDDSDRIRAISADVSFSAKALNSMKGGSGFAM